jgi:outer membrane protein assembly complex protein YaeT
MSPAWRAAIAALALTATGCHEELGIGDPSAEVLEVESLTFQGVESVDESALADALVTRASPWLPWGETRYFDRDQFQRDLERIEAFYEDQGYPEADIRSYDVDVTESGEAVRLRIVVDEGEPLMVRELRLENFDAVPAKIRERLRGELPLQPGEPLAYQQAVASSQLAADTLKNHGYPSAEVALDRQPASDGVAILLRAAPGPLSFFGPIDIAGNSSVDEDVIRRQLLFRPGERFSRSDVRESLRRIYALELFQFANIEVVGTGDDAGGEADTETAPRRAASGNLVPTRVTVAEGDHRRLEFSVGYGTEEKARAEAEWRHVNFYGGARTLGVHAKWSWLDRGIEGTFVQPYLFSPDLSLGLQGQAWYADEPAYTALSRGARATVRRRLGAASSASVSLNYEFQSSRIANEALVDPTLRDELIALGLDPTTGEQDGDLLAVAGDVTWMRVDDQLDPLRGYVTSLSIEQAGGWLPGTYNYFTAVGEVRGYVTPHERVTVAARARYGSVDPFGQESNVPFFKRFFLGGATSLRGWGRFEVAPLSGSGLPIGGNTLFESSIEVRTRLWGSLGLVAFVDAGQVWSDAWDARLGDLLYDAGPGLRYDTPVGPLRLDFAYQLNRLEGLRIDGRLQERPWRLHFSIGQAF